MFKRPLIKFIAAIAAANPPRKSGIEAFVPAMILLAPVLAIPTFALQLEIIHLATLTQPLRRQPFLTLSIDSLGIGVIVAAELIEKWDAPINVELAAYDRLPARQRALLRITTVLTGAALTALMLVGLWSSIAR